MLLRCGKKRQRKSFWSAEMSKEKTVHIALIGNPNSGKTSIFNRLTGLHQKVGNFPGVTVDKKSGEFTLTKGEHGIITDLPGTYSLNPTSTDEQIVLDTLLDPSVSISPDLILYVADVNNLTRHLVLLTQVMDFGIPVILLLNMVDVATNEGLFCDPVALGKSLGIAVISVNGRTGQGLENLSQAIADSLNTESPIFLDINTYGLDLQIEVADKLGISKHPFRALLAIHNYEKLNFISDVDKSYIKERIGHHNFDRLHNQFEETLARYAKLQPIVNRVLTSNQRHGESKTSKADQILTHPIWGSLIFIATLFIIFQAIFSWSTYPMGLIDSGMGWVIEATKTIMPAGLLSDFITEGILAGIGGVLIFIPQITILFVLISLLEEVGYMSRAVFLSDHLMRKFGLNGRSIVSLISGAACAVPAIMATRTISNTKERLITIFVTPFISCSARIPVFTILISFAVPNTHILNIFNLQGIVMMGLYALGVFAALGSAWAMKKLLHSKEHSFLMMELPTYKMPYWKNIGITVVQKVRAFVVNAGEIILVISMILWVLASFGPGDTLQKIDIDIRTEYQGSDLPQSEINAIIASKKIAHSYAGIMGKKIAPVIKPLGFDWKIGIALITSFAAREVFISTMATIYSVGSNGSTESVIDKMSKERYPDTGKRVYSSATAFSLLVFYVLAMQCMSTLAVVKRETKSYLVPIAQLIYMTGLAYLFSFITYQSLC